MDIEAAYRKMRAALDEWDRLDDTVNADGTEPAGHSAARDRVGSQLASAVGAIDQWMRKGGRSPKT